MLSAEIGLPGEVRRRVTDFLASCDRGALQAYICGLTERGTAAAAYTRLLELLGKDDMAMLACQLEAAVLAYDAYQAKGIPADVYFDTMKCFTRFLEETKRMTGEYCFDRGFWSYRQTSMNLFRIGELEYELCWEEQAVSMHIPSDVDFTSEAVENSLMQASEFLDAYFPECRKYPFVCRSWLLSPKLGGLLKADSNILRFQRRFCILSVQPESREFIQWLFEAPLDTPVERLREDTSLQRSVKALLQRGGNIGAARGVIQR